MSNAQRTILIVDDEPNLRHAVKLYLDEEGYTTFTAADGVDALAKVRDRLPDLIVMDVMMPQMDGFETLKRLRQSSNVPVIMLTVKGEESDKVKGLQLGADDYVPKPFSQRELLARIQAVLRRAESPAHLPRTELVVDEGLRLDFSRGEVLSRGKLATLSPTEYKLLYHLASNPGRIMTYETLLARIWGWEYTEEQHYVRLYVSYLRQKIEPDPSHPRYILTEKGLGYKFVDYRAGRKGHAGPGEAESMAAPLSIDQVIEQINTVLRLHSSPTEVTSALLATARRMLAAGEAYLVVRDGPSIRLQAADGLPPEASSRELDWEGSIESLSVLQASAMVLTDASRHPRFRDVLRRPYPVRAMAVFPVLAHGYGIAAIVVSRPVPAAFTPSELRWLSLLAGISAVLIENQRAGQAQERRAHQAEVLLDLMSQSGGAPESLLQRLADTLTRDLGVDRVDVLLLEEGGRQLECLGTASWPEDGKYNQEPLPVARGGVFARLLETGQPHTEVGRISDPTLRHRLGDDSLRSSLLAPIPVAGHRRGVLLLAARDPQAFGPEDQAFALVVAARIGVLVEEAELDRRRRAVERAETEAAARQQFVGVISHELKTPVAVIQAYADVLLRRAERSGDEANRDVVNRIREQAERMLYMVDQVLDLQRLEAGLMALETSRFDLAALARKSVEEMSTLTTQHRLLAEAVEPVYVLADRRRIEEVLSNLLQNAIRYSPDGGEITVKVQQDEGTPARAVVSVSDQGLGIAPDEQGQIFERFYQGRQRLYGGHVGLGLGLYISREIARRHGGDIVVESEPSHGSTFRFWLPTAGPEESEP